MLDLSWSRLMQLQLPLCVGVCGRCLRFATRTVNLDEKIKVELCEDTLCIYGAVDMFRVLLGAVDLTQEY